MVDWFKWKSIGIGAVGVGLILTGLQLGLLVLLQLFDWSAVPDLAGWQMVLVSLVGFLFVYTGRFLNSIADEMLEQRIQELKDENGGENR